MPTTLTSSRAPLKPVRVRVRAHACVCMRVRLSGLMVLARDGVSWIDVESSTADDCDASGASHSSPFTPGLGFKVAVSSTCMCMCVCACVCVCTCACVPLFLSRSVARALVRACSFCFLSEALRFLLPHRRSLPFSLIMRPFYARTAGVFNAKCSSHTGMLGPRCACARVHAFVCLYVFVCFDSGGCEVMHACFYAQHTYVRVHTRRQFAPSRIHRAACERTLYGSLETRGQMMPGWRELRGCPLSARALPSTHHILTLLHLPQRLQQLALIPVQLVVAELARLLY